MMTTTARTTAGLGMGALGIVLAGCATSPPPQAPPSTTIDPPPSATKNKERTAVTRAYKEFWKVSHQLDGMPPTTWRSTVEKVAVDPIKTQLLKSARAQREKGVEVYGHVTARITDVRITGDQATIRDCQDASQSGQADVASGEHKTRGVARNPVSATLTRDQSGQWRVKQITYPGGRC